jgi:hypothetical protein
MNTQSFSKQIKFVPLLWAALFLLISSNLLSAPSIKILSPNIELGEVNYRNTPVAIKIVVKNDGTDTLHIREVKPGCGCTVADISSKNIAAGDSATINASLDVSNYSGKITKGITVFSDDTKNPNAYIMLSCYVIRPFEVKPKYLSFDKVIVGEPSTTEVLIVNNSANDAVVKSVSIDKDYIIVNLKKDDVIKKGEPFKLLATAIATQKGSVRANIIIELYHPEENEIKIISYGNAIVKVASDNNE